MKDQAVVSDNGMENNLFLREKIEYIADFLW